MPKKLLIKSLSASGELLNVVSCFAGQVSVFRAHSPSELKPYQRALAGIQGGEKFSVSVDSGEYNPLNHNLVGFAEQKLAKNQTVREYLESSNVTSQMIDGILLSYGLEKCIDKNLLDLTPDEERRVRLLEASFHPEKALIIHEPFEPVASQWRERFAELLTNFSRNKNAIVIVTSLSYRPECWIDNDSIQRIQVGENMQRTIGFGAAGSQTNQMMNQIRDSVREEVKKEAPSIPPVAPAAAAATTPVLEKFHKPEYSKETWFSSFLSQNPFAIKALIAGSLFAISGIAIMLVAKSDLEKSPNIQEASNNDSQTPPNESSIDQPNTNGDTQNTPQQNDPSQINDVPIPPPIAKILDGYPEPIRVSLINTSNGVLPEKEEAEVVHTEPGKVQPRSGNIFKLLETASGKAGEQAANEEVGTTTPQEYVGNAEPDEAEQTEEQQRREAIRQKFLEAIRAAAERRQQAQQGAEF